jgi:hypothetical protein
MEYLGTSENLQPGEDSYIKVYGQGSVRWGDYSATVVDPSDYEKGIQQPC